MKPILTPAEQSYINKVIADGHSKTSIYEKRKWHLLNQVTKWSIVAAIVIELGIIYYFARVL
jgi:hypothetical protein